MKRQAKVKTSDFFPKRDSSTATKLASVVTLVAPAAPAAPDAPDASTPANFNTSKIASTALIARDERGPLYPSVPSIFLAQNGKACTDIESAGNRYVLAVGSHQLDLLIGNERRRQGKPVRSAELKEINASLQAAAELAGVTHHVWNRVAPISGGGIEIDLGDAKHTRVRITAGKVEIVTSGSETRFFRPPQTAAMVMPSATGNIKLLRKYINLHPASQVILIAWLTYTLAHPKLPTSKYVILVLNGHQGSGKSFLCYLILSLIDPNTTGIQMLPRNGKDLAIAAQNAHVLCYDNMRHISAEMSDHFCVASTGGALAGRQLFTDADQQVTRLHVALVLNGIHGLISQPDFAQRTLPLELLPIAQSKRKSEQQLTEEFQADLPAILRGIFDRIAEIFRYLPTAEVSDPERMIDFSRWMAASERVDGVPYGIYQNLYSDLLNDGQRENLQDNLLASTIMDFANDELDGETWSGTPADLLENLNRLVSPNTQRSREWPSNPIALSKRLLPLIAPLLTQDIDVKLTRGKQRGITISKLEEKR